MHPKPVALTREMRSILARLELISHGSTQSWNSDGRGGFERLMPPGESAPPHLYWLQQWNDAKSDNARDHVLQAATNELKAIIRRDKPAVSLSEDELMRRNILDAKGWTAKEVSIHYKYSERQIREIRMLAGLSGERGETIDAPSDDLTLQVRSLADGGMSERQIALIIGRGSSTVRRMLGKAA